MKLTFVTSSTPVFVIGVVVVVVVDDDGRNEKMNNIK